MDTIRNTAAAKMALLVPKGVQRYPDSGDKVKGIYSNPNPNRPFFKKNIWENWLESWQHSDDNLRRFSVEIS